MKLLTSAALVWIGISAVQAQTIKPGLWEMTSQAQGNSEAANAMASMQKELTQMPPAQRKMMEEMMAKQGMQLGSAPGGGVAVKLCMTQEMIDRNEVTSQQGDCKHTSSPRVGNTMKFAFTCTQPPSTGEGRVTFTSPEAYTTWVAVTSSPRGKPEKMETNTSGRWLGKDCGSVKPIAIPKK